jgi:hypothetical protein
MGFVSGCVLTNAPSGYGFDLTDWQIDKSRVFPLINIFLD